MSFLVPFRAYFFGDNSPKREPDYFLSLIKRCLEHYWKEVASKRHRTVLVINQCGWVTGQQLQKNEVGKETVYSKKGQLPTFRYAFKRPHSTITPVPRLAVGFSVTGI